MLNYGHRTCMGCLNRVIDEVTGESYCSKAVFTEIEERSQFKANNCTEYSHPLYFSEKLNSIEVEVETSPW